MERLQRILSQAGVCSRRQAEGLILAGRVKVNGQTIVRLGAKADPLEDRIEVNGRPLRAKEPIYIILNKPGGYVTTLSDPFHARTILELIKNVAGRVFPCGRLDKETEGLLILTNDGEFAHFLTHPKFKVAKTYMAKLGGSLREEEIDKLRKGVRLEDGFTQPAKVEILERRKDSTTIKITISEGRKREIRRMGETIGHPVLGLKRIKHGPWELSKLLLGEYREIDLEEVKAFKEGLKDD
ncbi:rRNA pseudouridine synthase [bacterium]|nr:rRNA pseudouridine synthase [bacterium]